MVGARRHKASRAGRGLPKIIQTEEETKMMNGGEKKDTTKSWLVKGPK